MERPTPRHDVLRSVAREVESALTEKMTGSVAAVHGLTLLANGLPAPVGGRCFITTRRNERVEAEVIGLREDRTVLTIFGEATGIAPGDRVECVSGRPLVPVGFDLLGRVIDARGEPLDGRPAPVLNVRYPLSPDAPDALSREPINEPLGLGVRAIDALLTAGRGQRLGVFAGTGVGKSVLMGMICRQTQADVNVVALVGERGREVRDFLDQQLGPEGLARSVVVVCTSDEAPALRVRCCLHATAVAEYFRDSGLNVLLMMDSLTRVAMAQRQIGVAGGEPPTSKGYPPSIYALLPRLLERAGRTGSGSITGVYTVLVEGDDVAEPLADAVRGILDGHIWLSRTLANRGHYPAIDVLESVSRVADDVVDPEHRAAAIEVRKAIAVWRDIEDLVNIGAYTAGTNPEYDLAVQSRERIGRFLTQDRSEPAPFADNVAGVKSLGAYLRELRANLG